MLTLLLGDWLWKHFERRANSTQGATHNTKMERPTTIEYMVTSVLIWFVSVLVSMAGWTSWGEVRGIAIKSTGALNSKIYARSRSCIVSNKLSCPLYSTCGMRKYFIYYLHDVDLVTLARHFMYNVLKHQLRLYVLTHLDCIIQES